MVNTQPTTITQPPSVTTDSSSVTNSNSTHTHDRTTITALPTSDSTAAASSIPTTPSSTGYTQAVSSKDTPSTPLANSPGSPTQVVATSDSLSTGAQAQTQGSNAATPKNTSTIGGNSTPAAPGGNSLPVRPGGTKTPAVSGTSTVCPSPPSVQNGGFDSSGPFAAGTPLTLTCSAGFTLVGQAMITCGTDLKWSAGFPSCLADKSNADESIGDNYYIGDSLPLWLAIILGMTFGVICLLMLLCMIMVCLRMCGIWKGAVLGESPTNAVTPDNVMEDPDIVYEDKGTAISYVDLEPFPSYGGPVSQNFLQTSRVNIFAKGTSGQPPDDSRYYYTKNERPEGRGRRTRNIFTESRYMDSTASSRPEPRIKAKKPLNKWMPHAREKRWLNTSTQ